MTLRATIGWFLLIGAPAAVISLYLFWSRTVRTFTWIAPDGYPDALPENLYETGKVVTTNEWDNDEDSYGGVRRSTRPRV